MNMMPAKKEGLYRYVLMASIVVTLTLCTRLYAAYQDYTDILIRGGKYFWDCQDNASVITDPTTGALTCDNQKDYIKTLILIQSSAEFTGAFIAGIALDLLGPQYSGFVGAGLAVSSIALLLLSSKSALWAAPLGAVFGGWAINILAFPAMMLQNYFPGQEALCSAIMVSAQCLSNSVFPLINTLWAMFPSWTFEGILGNYLMFLMIPSLVFYVWILPPKESNDIPHEDEKDVQRATHSEGEERRLSVTESVVAYGAKLETLMGALLSPEFICLILVDTVLYTCVSVYAMSYYSFKSYFRPFIIKRIAAT